MRRLAVVPSLLGLALGAGSAWAHGDVHIRIDALSRELAARPGDPTLLADRGALHALDEDWSAAADDLEAAWASDPSSLLVARQLANVRLHTGEPDLAAWLAREVVLRAPNDAEAHQLRARALSLVGDPAGSVEAYGRTLSLEKNPSPRLYLERAEAELARGPGHEEAAGAGLREGIAELGPIVTLVEPAVALEVSRGEHGRALELLDSLPDTVRGAPSTRLSRARLLVALGRLEHAGSELAAASVALERLPPSRRESAAMRALRAEVDEELAGLRAREEARLRERRAFWVGGALLLAVAALVFWASIRRAWLQREGRVRARP